jgi:hypothetical protein
MNKIKEHLFELAMLAILVRSFITGASISDALVLITLVISIVYTKFYMNRKKLDIASDIIDDVKGLKEQISMMKLDKGIRKVGTLGEAQQGSVIRENLRF